VRSSEPATRQSSVVTLSVQIKGVGLLESLWSRLPHW